jgi:biopolymer transport protein ExbD
VAPLAQRFGVTMGGGMAEDEGHCDATLGPSHLWFSRDNGLLREHATTAGRRADERVERVLTFTGQSLLGPPEAVAFLALSDDATERPPSPPRVERDGGDLIVSMDYDDAQPAKGRAQGLALEVGVGRVVVLGESGMLRAQREKSGALVGMNHPGCDNRKLALNIAHWLSRASPGMGAPAPAASAAESILVTLTWDAQHGVTTAQVGASRTDGTALDERLRVAAEQWTHVHSGEPRVTLQAERGVPWKDVVEAVNACHRLGLEQVDFAFEGRDGK